MNGVKLALITVLTVLSVTISAQFNPWSSSDTALATDFGAENINGTSVMRVVDLSNAAAIRYGRVVDRRAACGDQLGLLSVVGLQKGDYFTTTISTLSYTDIELYSYLGVMSSEKSAQLRFALYYRLSDSQIAYPVADPYWVESGMGDFAMSPFITKLDAVCDNQENIELRWVLMDDPETIEAVFLISTTIKGSSKQLSIPDIAADDQIYVIGNTLIVCANSVQLVPVRNIEGRIVRWLSIKEGENRFAGFTRGVYLVGSYKVVL